MEFHWSFRQKLFHKFTFVFSCSVFLILLIKKSWKPATRLWSKTVQFVRWKVGTRRDVWRFERSFKQVLLHTILNTPSCITQPGSGSKIVPLRLASKLSLSLYYKNYFVLGWKMKYSTRPRWVETSCSTDKSSGAKKIFERQTVEAKIIIFNREICRSDEFLFSRFPQLSIRSELSVFDWTCFVLRVNFYKRLAQHFVIKIHARWD